MDDFDGGSYDGGSNEGDSYEGGDECDITVPANEADIGEQASDSASIEEPAPAKEADIGVKPSSDEADIGARSSVDSAPITDKGTDKSAEKGEVSVSKENANEKTEHTETVTRELTPAERQGIKDNLGWSDKKIDNKCTIDENGTIHYKTDRHDLEGKTNEVGVPYERNSFVYNGQRIEGVFPVFDSKYDAQLDPADFGRCHTTHERICNTQLAEAIEKDPELAGKFNAEQLEQIKNRETPDGFTWHHNEEPGKMQLVEYAQHAREMGGTAHTGGASIWGNKSRDTENKPSGSHKNKGESF